MENTARVDDILGYPLDMRLFDESPILAWLADRQGQCVYFNRAWLTFTGRSLIEEVGGGWLAGVWHEDRTEKLPLLKHCIEQTRAYEATFRLRRHDGEYRWIYGHMNPLQHRDEVRGFAAYGLDITEIMRSREAERLSRTRLELAFCGANDGVWDRPDIAADYEYWSPRLYEMLGYPEQTLPSSYSTLRTLLHPGDIATFDAALARIDGGEDTLELEYRLRTATGAFRWFRSRSIVVRDRDGRPCRMTGSLEDIHDRRVAEQALQQEKEKYEKTLASLNEGVVSIDRDGCIVYMNGAAERLLGCDMHEHYRRRLDHALPVVDEDGVRLDLQALCASTSDSGRTLEAYLVPRPGRRTVVEMSLAPLVSANGVRNGDVIVLRDVTQTRQMTRRMLYQATHDSLTNLVNRREFERRLERVISTAHESASTHALCFIDLDRFKIINDACGHAAGDDLLKQVARLLKGSVRKRDTVCRLGGDEFGILMEHCDLEHALRSANIIRDRIHAYRFIRDGRSFVIGASIGVAALDADGDTLVSIMRRADAACYAAKEQGRNRVHIGHPDDAEVARVRGEMRWAARLEQALNGDGFDLFYQPVCREADCSTVPPYCEVLLRLRDETGILPAGAFLGAAERYGLSASIDRWVVQNLLDHMSKGDLPGDDNTVWSVNLSGQSLGDESFGEFVASVIEQAGIAAHRLCFEFTEADALAHSITVSAFCALLRSHGCQFALDDFGSGLSSLSCLKAFPVQYLKIDSAHAAGEKDDLIARGILEAIIRIGHLAGTLIIAERVESLSAARGLRELGVDYIQGGVCALPQPLISSASATARSTKPS